MAQMNEEQTVELAKTVPPQTGVEPFVEGDKH